MDSIIHDARGHAYAEADVRRTVEERRYQLECSQLGLLQLVTPCRDRLIFDVINMERTIQLTAESEHTSHVLNEYLYLENRDRISSVGGGEWDKLLSRMQSIVNFLEQTDTVESSEFNNPLFDYCSDVLVSAREEPRQSMTECVPEDWEILSINLHQYYLTLSKELQLDKMRVGLDKIKHDLQSKIMEMIEPVMEYPNPSPDDLDEISREQEEMASDRSQPIEVHGSIMGSINGRDWGGKINILTPRSKTRGESLSGLTRNLVLDDNREEPSKIVTESDYHQGRHISKQSKEILWEGEF